MVLHHNVDRLYNNVNINLAGFYDKQASSQLALPAFEEDYDQILFHRGHDQQSSPWVHWLLLGQGQYSFHRLPSWPLPLPHQALHLQGNCRLWMHLKQSDLHHDQYQMTSLLCHWLLREQAQHNHFVGCSFCFVDIFFFSFQSFFNTS